MEHATPEAAKLAGLLAKMLLLFGISGVIVPLLQRLHITPVLGYLLCGVVVGPYALGVWAAEYAWLKPFNIVDTDTAHLLGELGVIAMLFMIGLELSIKRLKELKYYVLGLGSLQILVSGAVICLVALLFDNTMTAALLLGASLALSSTAIVMQLLQEKHLGNRKIGTLCFSILLMQDLAVVPIVVLASAFAGQSDQSVAFIVAKSFIIAVIAVVGVYILGSKLIRPLWRWLSISKNPEWLSAFALFVVIACATITQEAGLSAALGAFLAGLIIAETESSHAIEVIIAPLKGLLLGIFFLSVGMMIDMRAVLATPWLISMSVIGIFAVKAIILYPLCRIFSVPRGRSAQASIMLSQPGEFAFLILSIALSTGMMPRGEVQFFLLVTALAMCISPLLFNLAPHVAKWVSRKTTETDDIEHETNEEARVLIAGLGRIGIKLATLLEQNHIPYLALDNNAERVRKRQKEGYSVKYGDARQHALWHKLGAGEASAVVICVDNSETAEHIVASMRKEWPLLPVIARAKDAEAAERLHDYGACRVIAEADAASRQLTDILLEHVIASPTHNNETQTA